MNTDSDDMAPRPRALHPLLQRPHAWRERIRQRRTTRLAWKAVTGLVGTAVLIAGLIMVPFPGPGWLVVIIGLAILASEFAWAQNLLHFVRAKVHGWTEWIKVQPLGVRVAVGLATLVFVGCVLWGVAAVFGVPGFVPSWLVPPLPGL